MQLKRSIAVLGTAGALAFGMSPAGATAAQHWTKAQCHQYQVLANSFGISKKLQKKTLKQHGCVAKPKHKKHKKKH